MPRRTDAGRVERLLHPFLVTERHGLVDGHAGQTERLADPRREDHVRLPQALDPVEAGVAGEAVEGAEHPALVGEVDLLVVREPLARGRRQRRHRLVADTDDGGADRGEPAGEVRHLGWEAGGDHDDVHCASTSSTRMPVTMRFRASRTTSVSGSRTMTYPSPS